MEKIEVKLETFEGPLDLLLYLISKNKLNICDIRITDLVGQYLEQIGGMRERQMEVTSDFLEMAARLVYIKTVSLLPRPEEAARLAQELSGRLLEYRECKRIAVIFGARFRFDSYTRNPEKIGFDSRYRGSISPQEIYGAYFGAAGRGKRFLPPPAEAFSGIVSHKIVSVASRIVGVLRCLRTNGKARYADLFRNCRGRSELIATFLAVLELIKGRRIRVGEDGGDAVVLVDGGEKKWKSKRSREP